MSPPRSPNQSPPRLLQGVSLLLWGGISEHPIIGLILAFIVEAPHWTKTRWHFDSSAFQRAWRASLVLFLIVLALEWLNASVLTVMTKTFVWLPVIFFPLQFVQIYGQQDRIPLTLFSHFLRKRQHHAKKYGLPFREVWFHFGYPYFVFTMLAASLGKYANSPVFFPGVALLVAWLFYRQFSRRPHIAPIGAAFILIISLAAGYGGQQALTALYRHFAFRHYDPNHLGFARETRTAIGSLGEIKQSPQILWRVRPIQGQPPSLLRVASYNFYLKGYWGTKLPAGVQRGIDDFTELDSFGIDEPFRITGRAQGDEFLPVRQATHSALPRFNLRGSFTQKGLIPVPNNATSLIQPNQSIGINPFGTISLDPLHPIVDAEILFSDPASTALAPWPSRSEPDSPMPDLHIPENETEVVNRVASELGLHELPLTEKITRIQRHFRDHFTYTRYLQHSVPQHEIAKTPFVSLFLESNRRGHCEYFATATAFLLRASGTPTRYATGFAVIPDESHPDDILVRGTHAHAWVTAWDDSRQKWIDVDLTPPTWVARETPRMPAWQAWLDRWQILRDDLIAWRTRPGNFTIAAIIIAIPIGIGGLLIIRRLWRSKHRLGPHAASRQPRPTGPRTPLHDLEQDAQPLLGPKPPSTPLTKWLAGLTPQLTEPHNLNHAIRLHQQLRFDPITPPQSLLDELTSCTQTLRQDIQNLIARTTHPPS